MGHPFYLWLKNCPPALRVWLHPMLLISVVFHSWLLVLPMPPESVPEPEPSPPKEEVVKITKLRSLSPQPSPKSTPQKPNPNPKPTPKRVQPVRQSVVEPLTVQKPKEEEPPPEDEPEDEPLEVDDNQAEEKPPVKNQDENKPADDKTEDQSTEDNSDKLADAGDSLLDQLKKAVLTRLLAQNEGDTAANTPKETEEYMESLPYELVPESQHPYFFRLGEKFPLNPKAFGWLTIPQASPRNAYIVYIEPELTTFGFKVEQLDPYGDADFYKAENNDGLKFYMSLVGLGQTRFKSGAIVVLWVDDPRAGS